MSLLPEEKEALARIGWKEGDPIPDNLQDLLATLLEADGISTEGGVSSKLAEMSPENRQAVAQALGMAKVVQAERQAIPEIPGAAPGVNEALRALHTGQGVEVVDDLSPSTKPADTPQPPPTEESRAGLNSLKSCPHCNWDLSRAEPGEADQIDKLGFLQAILGNQRFFKEYVLLNGQLTLTFRTLFVDETDAVSEQVLRHVRAGEVGSAEDMIHLAQTYRAYLSLEMVHAGEHAQPIAQFKRFQDIEHKQKANEEKVKPALVAYREYIEHEVVRTEQLRHFVGRHYLSFTALVNQMEARVDDPDFWKTNEVQPS